MNVYRVTTYTFLGCELNLFKEKDAFWVHIKCYKPAWKMVTSVPKSCPQEAMMLAEIEVLKTILKQDKCPACVLAVKRKNEIVIATNKSDRQLFGIDPKGDIAEKYISSEGLPQYKQFLETVRKHKKAAQRLRCIHADGGEFDIICNGETIYSPISLNLLVYTRVIECL